VYAKLLVGFVVNHPRWEPGAKCGLPSYVVSGSQAVGVEGIG
jgi:hypothetical protein